MAHNLNHKNNELQFFEYCITYHTNGVGNYQEHEHLSIYVTGNIKESSWKAKAEKGDFYYIKGVVDSALQLLGLNDLKEYPVSGTKLQYGLELKKEGQTLVLLGQVHPRLLQKFDIRQAVTYADFEWERIIDLALAGKLEYHDIPKFPAVQRDLAIIVDQEIPFEKVEKLVRKANINRLRSLKLFDVFESEKLGRGKKSLAINFTFLDEEKTLTDKEIDEMMQKLMTGFEKELHAEIRK